MSMYLKKKLLSVTGCFYLPGMGNIEWGQDSSHRRRGEGGGVTNTTDGLATTGEGRFAVEAGGGLFT